MSRIWFGIALLSVAATGHAQFPGAPLPTGQPIGGEFQSKVVDPKAVEIPLVPGMPLSDVLTSLTDRGFHIKWNPEQLQPHMKLLEKPKATRVDNLLNEILEPWGLHADADLMRGGYLVRDLKRKSKKFVVEQNGPP
jgi:hypothetical protein